MTLSQAFSNNKNATISKPNSVERSQKRTSKTARRFAKTKDQSNYLVRGSQNSQNLNDRHSSKSKDREKVDVEDYWTKWLEFK